MHIALYKAFTHTLSNLFLTYLSYHNNPSIHSVVQPPIQLPYPVSLQGRAVWLSGLAASGATICQPSPSDCRSLGEAGWEVAGLLEGPALALGDLQLSGWCQESGWCQMTSRRLGPGWAGGSWWWFDSADLGRWWGEGAGWCSKEESGWWWCGW